MTTTTRVLAHITAHPSPRTYEHVLETVDRNPPSTDVVVFSLSCTAICRCRGHQHCVFLCCRMCVLMF